MSKEDRVFKHYKSLKYHSPLRFEFDRECDWLSGCSFDPLIPHGHGHYETTTSNQVWLTLARVHKMSVREVKDIITARRNK